MFDTTPALQCGDRELRLDRPLIMGIINVTPDSFSDGGDFFAVDHAVAHGIALIGEGADILDVGGESTRPGAVPVTPEDELARVIPVIEGLRAHIVANGLPTVISVDTYKPEVMKAAAMAGAGMINDVRALAAEGALAMASSLQLPVVLMHAQGDFGTMQDDPQYADVTGDVHRFLTERVFACEMAGIDKRRIVIDPGFGFGKSTRHNLELLARLERLKSIGVPLLAGLSRKRTLGEITGHDEAKDRVHASVAAHLLAVMQGAQLVRVHDVAATKDALAVWQAVQPFLPKDASAAAAPKFDWPED